MLQAIWAWLPAFRIVAETEHLPTASRRLGISASALSRTIRMIEQELGEELFSRSGRNIALNDAGAKLLGAVRDAMRRVHQGIHSLELDEIIGNTRIAADRLMSSSYVLSALTELRASHPRLHATVVPLEGCDGARTS